jgi:hypothetical protein
VLDLVDVGEFETDSGSQLVNVVLMVQVVSVSIGIEQIAGQRLIGLIVLPFVENEGDLALDGAGEVLE